MTDFDEALRARLARNDEMAAARRAADDELDRLLEERRLEAERAEAELLASRSARHAELVTHVTSLADGLRHGAPGAFVIRLGWAAAGSGDFLAKLATRTLEPARSLFIELDRDDDEVLVRWSSDVGSSLELWRVLEVTPDLLTELVLQVADDALWAGRSGPPAFPQPG